MKRFLWLGLTLFLCIVWFGCGDTFRPIIIPNPPVFPNPSASHTVVAINDNGTVVAGSAMVIDVSGDADVSEANLGLAPVHAVLQNANQVLVVNHSVTGKAADSLFQLSFSGTSIGSATAITLPPNSAPDFVAVAPNDTTAYVTLPNLVPDAVNFPNDNAVGVVMTQSSSLVDIIKVGNNPYALTVTPDRSKLYVANQGDGTISAFNTVSRSSRAITGSLTFAPIWLIPRSDSQRVYVLEQTNGTLGGTLASIDTTSSAGPDPLTESAISVPTALKMVYDSNKNRLYIPGEALVQVNGAPVLKSAVVIVDVSQSSPSPLATIPIATVPPASRSAQDPCALTSPATLNSVDVAALPDGSRAYVGSYYEDTSGNICPQVTVIDATSNTLKSAIAVPGFPAYDAFCSPTSTSPHARFRIMMAAAGDSTRAYLSSCDGGNVNFIDTSNDTYIQNLPAPVGTRQTNPPGPVNLPQNPVFLFAGP